MTHHEIGYESNEERYYPSLDPMDPTGRRYEMAKPTIVELNPSPCEHTQRFAGNPHRILVDNVGHRPFYRIPDGSLPDFRQRDSERLFDYRSVQARRWYSCRVRYVGQASGEKEWRDTFNQPLNKNDDDDRYILGAYDRDEGFYHIVVWWVWCEIDSNGNPYSIGDERERMPTNHQLATPFLRPSGVARIPDDIPQELRDRLEDQQRIEDSAGVPPDSVDLPIEEEIDVLRSQSNQPTEVSKTK